jgi:hypothetical protein
MGDANTYKFLVGRLERKIPLGRPRRRWEDNIIMVGRCGLDMSGSGQVPVAGPCEKYNKPSGSVKVPLL